jgi:ribosomal protein L10
MNMLLKKLDQKIIAESTGLTVEEIEKLRTQNIGH